MIEDEAQYQQAKERLVAQRSLFDQQRERLMRSGLSEREIRRVMDPLERFHLHLKEAVRHYAELAWKAGEREGGGENTNADRRGERLVDDRPDRYWLGPLHGGLRASGPRGVP